MSAADAARPIRGKRVKRTLALIFGLLGALGLAFLVLGFLLTGEWEAERTVRLEARPGVVFAQIDSLPLWDGWTVWSDVPSTFEGPTSGVGAARVWDDDSYGSGRFTVIESVPDSTLAYEVEVEGGALVVRGRFILSPDGAGTRLTWRETGDFGRNPLLGYVARRMGERQGEELERSLERLRGIVEGSP